MGFHCASENNVNVLHTKFGRWYYREMFPDMRSPEIYDKEYKEDDTIRLSNSFTDIVTQQNSKQSFKFSSL